MALMIRVSDTRIRLTNVQVVAAAGVRHLTQTQPHAKRHRPDVRQRVSPRRPPARPPGGGHRKTLLDHPAVCKNLKNPTRPSARKDQAIRARCGVGLGWAGRLDAPGGNRREPKADEVEHGAVRSEGSGPQSEPRPPQAHAAPGVPRTPTIASNPHPSNPKNTNQKITCVDIKISKTILPSLDTPLPQLLRINHQRHCSGSAYRHDQEPARCIGPVQSAAQLDAGEHEDAA